MQEFNGKVAVVTGAAGGIGRGLAQHCGQLGMSVVLADIDPGGLEKLGAELEELGVANLVMPTDVADAESVERLAEASFGEFGQVDLLFNNAGVLRPGNSWQQSVEDWQWHLGVNLMGVVHGLRSFVPRLLAQGSAAHIVNTASLGALLTMPTLAPYQASKAAVRALTETLHMELQKSNPEIGVSVLCPGPVATAMLDSANHLSVADDVPWAGQQAEEQAMKTMSPARLARIVFEAICERRFWIFPHQEFKPHYRQQVADMLAEHNG